MADADFGPCLGGGSSRDCEFGECTARGSCIADGESTSARLARIRRERDGVREELARQAAANEDLAATLAQRSAALAASQQDLTRVEAERDRLNENERRWTAAFEDAESERLDAKSSARRWRERFNEADEEISHLRALLDQVIADRAHLREDVLQRDKALESAHEELAELREVHHSTHSVPHNPPQET